jgi:hypothetical protein
LNYKKRRKAKEKKSISIQFGYWLHENKYPIFYALFVIGLFIFIIGCVDRYNELKIQNRALKSEIQILRDSIGELEKLHCK